MPGMTNMVNGTSYSAFGTGYGEANYEVFDPLNWMLDGLVDFPYSFTAMQGLEQQGLGAFGTGVARKDCIVSPRGFSVPFGTTEGAKITLSIIQA